ncbi:MAG TPA: ParB N-terminal domain-containing protein, partial [Terriglobales bacterium]|nr:ParB N-terminal domain-containing protein [Terriglobales bacterium]
MDLSKKRGLGRGLSALIPSAPERPTAEVPAAPPVFARLSAIAVNPWQPRRQFTEAAIDELANSIRERGIVQP